MYRRVSGHSYGDSTPAKVESPTLDELRFRNRDNKSYSHGRPHHRFVYADLPDLLDKRAKSMPNKEAHVFWMVREGGKIEREAITFRQLSEKSMILASAFLEMGLKEEDRIVIVGNNCPEWVYAEYAALRLRILLIRLPENFMKGSAIVKVVSEYRCRAVIVDPGVNDATLKSLAKVLPGKKTLKNMLKSLPNLRLITLRKPETDVHFMTIEELLEETKIKRDDVMEIQESIDPDDPAIINSTSGSGGFPKFVVVSHFAYINNVYAGDSIHLMDEMTRFFNDRPFSWVGSGLFSSVIFGITMIHMDTSFTSKGENASVLFSIFAEEEVTVSTFMTTFLKEAASAKAKGQIHVPPTLKYVLNGGDELTEDLVTFCEETFEGTVLIYASSETFLVASKLMKKKDRIHEGVPELQVDLDPLPNVELRVTDKNKKIVPLNHMGNLWVRSPYLFKEYLDDEELTDKVMADGGWYNSGDVGMMTDARKIKLMGRQGEIIHKGKEDIYPVVIEKFMRTFTAAEQVYVAGVPDKKLGQEVCVCITFEAGHYVSPFGLRRFVNRKLPSDDGFVMPKYFIVFDEFPMLPNGKLDRKKIVTMALERMEKGEREEEEDLHDDDDEISDSDEENHSAYEDDEESEKENDEEGDESEGEDEEEVEKEESGKEESEDDNDENSEGSEEDEDEGRSEEEHEEDDEENEEDSQEDGSEEEDSDHSADDEEDSDR